MYWYKIEQPGFRSVCFLSAVAIETNCNCHLNLSFLTLLYVDTLKTIICKFPYNSSFLFPD